MHSWLWKIILVLFAVKPFVDLTQTIILFNIGGVGVTPPRLFGTLFVTVGLFVYLGSRVRIPTTFLVFLFIGCNLMSSLVGIGEGDVSASYAMNKLLRVAGCYFTYFAFATLCHTRQQLCQFVFVSWVPILLANLITILSWVSGVHNVTGAGTYVRLAGFYNDAGVVGINALLAVVFAVLYVELEQRDRWELRKHIRVLLIVTVISSVMLLIQSLTKSVLIASGLFCLAWWGMYKRKHFVVVPLLIALPIALFSASDRFRDRLSNESRVFLKGDYSEAAMGRIASGRYGMWTELLHKYQRLPRAKQLIGTGLAFAAHNQYIAYLMQLGVLGLGVFVILKGTMLYLVLQRLRVYHEPELFITMLLTIIFLALAVTLSPFYNSNCWSAMALLGISLSPRYHYVATPAYSDYQPIAPAVCG